MFSTFKHFFYVLFCIAFLFSMEVLAEDSPQSPRFTLEDLYRLAIADADRIRMAKESVHMAKALQDQARAVLRPEIKAFASHQLYPDPAHTDPDRLNSAGVRMGQSMTLNGKEWVALQMSRRALEKSGKDLEAVTVDYLFEVGSRFYQIIRAEEEIEIEEAEVRRLSRHLDQVLARVRLNDATRPDLLRTQAELSGAKSRRSVAAEALEDERAMLSALIHLPLDFRLATPERSGAAHPETSLESLVEEALNARPELAALKLEARIAEDKVALQKGERWPVISWSAQYQDARPSPSESKDTQSLSLGLELSVPLYTGGLTPARIREAEAEKRQAHLRYAQSVRDIRLEVQRAYHGLQKALSGLNALEDQVRFATENYLAVSRQFEVGLANIVDLMDANSLMLTAQSSLATTRLDSHLARLSLDYATGRLKERISDLIPARDP